MAKTARKKEGASKPRSTAGRRKGGGKLTKRQSFQVVTMRRSQINLAPYNPRVIDDESRARLRASLDTFGLVNTPVWNRRTGNLVGGHQRLMILDELEGGQDYEVEVAAIDVTESQEKKLNVKLNNTSMMGAWNQEALAALVLENPGSIERMGFDSAEVDVLCGSEAVTRMLEEMESPESEPARESRGPRQKKGPVGRPEDKSPHIVVVFGSSGELDGFLRAKGLPLDGRYIDSKRFLACLGLG